LQQTAAVPSMHLLHRSLAAVTQALCILPMYKHKTQQLI